MTEESHSVRVRLLVAYRGTSFAGFAVNRDVRTVAGELEDHISRVVRHPISITGAGRTDRGVHAWGQVVTFDTTATDLDLGRLQRSINSACGPDIACRDATIVPESFDARFSATWRRYRYRILTSAAPNPFLADMAWHVPITLDLAAMELAAPAFVGQHDFSSFCRCPKAGPSGAVPSLERTVLDVGWSREDVDLLRFEIRARAFCHQMVRSIVGTLVDVGRGRIAPDAIPAILVARRRSAAGSLAPPHGLCLHDVGYPAGDADDHSDNHSDNHSDDDEGGA